LFVIAQSVILPSMPNQIVTYQTDHRHRILAVSASWDAFAVENGAESHALAAAVVGRSLFEYIEGLEVRHLYEILLKTVLETGVGATVPLHCDSPSLRRKLLLSIRPMQFGVVEYEGRIVEIAPREPVLILDSTRPRGPEMVYICSFCKRIEQAGDWLDPATYLLQSNALAKEILPRLSHGVCPDCYWTAASEYELLNKFKA
jgi:hypothetical protein